MDTFDRIKLYKSFFGKQSEKFPGIVEKVSAIESNLENEPTPENIRVAANELNECMEGIPVETKARLEEGKWNSVLPIALRLTGCQALLPQGNGGWTYPPVQSFQVRGINYLDDGVKDSSDPPLFFLRGVQMVRCGNFQFPVHNKRWCAVPKGKTECEWLIVNYMIPGQENVQIVCYFTASSEALEVIRGNSDCRGGWQKLLVDFWAADHNFCDEHFKLIPSVVDGPWPVKFAVGNKPALIGKKIKQHYFRDTNVFEIDIDISSSALAANILRLVRGSSTAVVVDLGITIEGKEPHQLPERILCQARYSNVDFTKAESV